MVDYNLNISLNYLDPIKGGYKGAPKFPTFNLYETLLYFYNKTSNVKYLEPVTLLIKQLCSKGIYDHVEGGISRYTIDEDWVIPHFEKMLYDNGPMISVLSNAFKKTGNITYLKKLSQTCDWVIDEMQSSSGGYYSTIDADSENKEGKFYVWSKEELDKTVVITGALIPYEFGSSSDGFFNLGCALSFVQTFEKGVYIAMHGKYFNWNEVKKNKEKGVFEKK